MQKMGQVLAAQKFMQAKFMLCSASNTVPWLTHCQFIEAAKAASGRLSFVAMLEQQLPVDTGILLAHAFTSSILQQFSPKFTLHHDQ